MIATPHPSWAELLLLPSIFFLSIYTPPDSNNHIFPIYYPSLMSSKIKMADLRSHGGGGLPLHIIDTATSVDCARDVGLRRSFRSFVDCLMAPYCCGHQLTDPLDQDYSASTVLTGTFFGHRRGRVCFCLQRDPRAPPLLLVDLAVPTAFLAREMQQGLLRIALEHCGGRGNRAESLFSVPVWFMYCNGRKVGFAVRRAAGEGDLAMLGIMKTVSAGAGVLPAVDIRGDLMYLRARFERVIGSADSESFHMINPAGSTRQELSIFLSRS